MSLPFEFVVREGPEKGQRITLPAERFTIGAGEGCALRFPANMVRELHAEVFRAAHGGFELEDRTGASLVWVDGQVVKKAPLSSGSIVRLGRLELLFVSLEDTASLEATENGGGQPTPMRLASSPPAEGGGGLAALRAPPPGLAVSDSTLSPSAPGRAPSGSGRFAAGDVVEGRYRVTARLAAGGMGEVYKVEHIELGKPLAMKVMLPGLNADQEFINRFKIEAVAASRIGHPNIIDISDFGRTGEGRFFFVMEFLDGVTLSSLVHRQGPQAPGRAVALTLQVARALAAAHELHIVHRDLKPDNVMVLQRPGNPDFIKVLDFGVARVKVGDESIGQTALGTVVGTPQYMSPEQARAIVVDARSDIYSLGLILHELLTGKPAFTAETPHLVMVKQVAEAPPPLPDWVPEELKELVFDMLEKDPADRPQEMRHVVAVLNELNRVLKTSDFAVPTVGAKEHTSPTPGPGKRTPPTPERGPTPPRVSSGDRSAPRVVEPTVSGAEPVARDGDRSAGGLDSPRRPSRAPLVIGGLLVVALGGGGAVLLGGPAPVERPAPVAQVVTPRPIAVAPLPAVEELATVRIESMPEGAEVVVDGVLLGNTPLTLKRKLGARVEVVLQRAGFRAATRTLVMSAEVPSVSVVLEAEGAERPEEPPPRQ
ncbi:MAG: protein kinase [Myxococcus sp.]|nr:protein kinase [Myxococcus sp.]